jgi:hypothetical protein
VNNDGIMDMFVADMAATTHQKDQRTMAVAAQLSTSTPPDRSAGGAAVQPECTLHQHRDVGRFMEVRATLAGLGATDWTWSVRLEDLDNDGRLDLFVTNGMHREVHNADLVMRVALAESPPRTRSGSSAQAPSWSEQHVAYRNLGDLRFEDVSVDWGLNQRGVSFGTALWRLFRQR